MTIAAPGCAGSWGASGNRTVHPAQGYARVSADR
jgi:hypothetical protein